MPDGWKGQGNLTIEADKTFFCALPFRLGPPTWKEHDDSYLECRHPGGNWRRMEWPQENELIECPAYTEVRCSRMVAAA